MTDSITKRLDLIEKKLENLEVTDLPLAQLQRKLESDWQPDAAVLLEPGSVASALGKVSKDQADQTLLAVAAATSQLTAKIGTGSITIPNGANSGSVSVTHGLGKTPAMVLVEPISGFGGSYSGTALWALSFTATTFLVEGTNYNGYASGIVVTFNYLAIG